MNFSAQQMNELNQQIQQLVSQNKNKLTEEGTAYQHGFAEKISLLSNTIAQHCKPCSETDLHMKMLLELANDLPKLNNISKPVLRSVEKRFSHIVKHLQKEHQFSIKNQHREAWIILLMSLLGIVGIILSAFTNFYLYPIFGVISGGLIGYYIGSNIDKKMEKQKKVLAI